MQNVRILLHKAIAKNDKDAMLQIIQKFKPLIKSISYQLAYDGAESDIEIFLLELIHKMGGNALFFSEKQLVSCIVKSLNNKKVDIFRHRKLNDIHILSDCVERVDTDFVDEVCLKCVLEKLTYKQQYVIIAKYYYGYSDVEIAGSLNISRQAVNRIKRRGETILRAELM